MNNFHILYAVSSLMTESYQDVVDFQLNRQSIVEQNLNERHDAASDAYVE